MKISKSKVLAHANPNGDTPPATKLIVNTIADWLNKVLPWINKMTVGLDNIDFKVLKINAGRQVGNTFVLKAITDLYANDMVVLFCEQRMIKVHEFDRIPGIKAYSIFSIDSMLKEEGLKDRVLFCDVPREVISRETWNKIRQFGFEGIVCIG